jgi:hypothetical protein
MSIEAGLFAVTDSARQGSHCRVEPRLSKTCTTLSAQLLELTESNQCLFTWYSSLIEFESSSTTNEASVGDSFNRCCFPGLSRLQYTQSGLLNCESANQSYGLVDCAKRTLIVDSFPSADGGNISHTQWVTFFCIVHKLGSLNLHHPV